MDDSAALQSSELEILSELSVKQLKARLADLNLPQSGSKAELLARLSSGSVFIFFFRF